MNARDPLRSDGIRCRVYLGFIVVAKRKRVAVAIVDGALLLSKEIHDSSVAASGIKCLLVVSSVIN